MNYDGGVEEMSAVKVVGYTAVFEIFYSNDLSFYVGRNMAGVEELDVVFDSATLSVCGKYAILPTGNSDVKVLVDAGKLYPRLYRRYQYQAWSELMNEGGRI